MDFKEYDTRVGAYVVIVDDENRILLVLWNEGEPQWTMVGGGVELHEQVDEAAVREAREETGYDVRLERLLGVDSVVVPSERRLTDTTRPLRGLRVIYEATVVGGQLTHEVGGTTDEARWIPLDEVESLPRVGLVDVAIAAWRGASSGR